MSHALYDKVSSTINAQSVAREMFQSNALTVKELQSVQSKHSESVKAAEQLLNIVMNQSHNVYSCFLDALKKTGHQHVFEVIISGSCKGQYGVLFGFRPAVASYTSCNF